MRSLGLPDNWLWRPILCALAFIPATYLLNWLLLTYKTVDIDVAKARKSDEKAEELLRKVTRTQTNLSDGIRSIAVSLHEYTLEVRQRRLFHPNTSKTILQPLSTSFEPGKINVIMGPSGSGKTSLLQSLANRLSNTLFSRYQTSGKITFNGAEAHGDVLRSIISFVTQEDDALMPALTVRETLQFAAGLRLPPWMSSEQKRKRAEEVLLKMGLKDCADNIIGSELKKGISGGQKRRVSIAIQILTEPRILLLDEPTSGLDAFTATSVIDAVKALAEEGRTVIMTIHQPRSDLFSIFDNVLLLAKGGVAVYSGPGQEMTRHFHNLGYECPRDTNPADFVLDLVTSDLQTTDGQSDEEKVKRFSQALSAATGEESSAQITRIMTPAEVGSFERKMNPFRITFPLVFRRSLINIYRTPDIILARTTQVAGLSVLLCLFYAPMKFDQESVQSRLVKITLGKL